MLADDDQLGGRRGSAAAPPGTHFVHAIDGTTEVSGEDVVVHVTNADGTIDVTPAGLRVAEPALVVETAHEVWGYA